MSKAQIIETGMSLGVDFSKTVSCYQANAEGLACGQCESCRLRKEGFQSAGIPDPTHYL
jgi:7-cyano-7-deazaguanine synthase